MDISEIKTFMKVRGITQKDLSQMANIPLQTIRKIFAGYTSHPRIDTIQAIEKALGIEKKQYVYDEDEMLAKIGAYPLPDLHKIPLVGQVVAGKPVETEEYMEGYVSVGYSNYDEYFALRVKGDSMINAGIHEKSILIVHKQNYATNGDIIVASVDGESTVKHYREEKGVIFLMPENNAYTPIIVTDKNTFYIFGKVVEVRTML